jgi:hypothetical protein
MALPSLWTTTGSPPADHGLASRDDGLLDDDTGSNPIIDDKEVPEEGQYTLQASLDASLPVDEDTCFNSPIDPKKVQEEVQDVVRASLDACLHVDDDTGFNLIINDNKVLQEAQDALQPQRNLATLPPTHSITPGSQFADHGPSTLHDALPVDEVAGFNSIVLHDKIDKDVRQGVVELVVELKSKAVIKDDEYTVLAKTNDHTMDVGVPDNASLSTQAPSTDTLFYTNSTYVFFFPMSLLNDSHYSHSVYFFSMELSWQSSS